MAAQPAPATIRRLRIVMGTTFVVEAQAPSRAQAVAAVAAAFAAADTLVHRFDPDRAGSDLCRLGAAPPGTPVAICEETLQMLRFAQRLRRASDGLFDPCVPARAGSLADLELSADPRPQAVARLPIAIDCGGIAKGYIIDAATEALMRAGCLAGLVNAGGDLRSFGARRDLLLRGPGRHYRPVGLEGAFALAVSEPEARGAPPGHRGYYVRHGVEAARRYAAVCADTAMTADALTKCALLAPRALRTRLLRAYGARLLR